MMKDQLNTASNEAEAALTARDETVAQCELMRKDIDALVIVMIMYTSININNGPKHAKMMFS